MKRVISYTLYMLVIFLTCLMPIWGDGSANTAPTEKPPVILELSVIVGTKDLQLLCVAKNTGKSDIITTEFGTNCHGIYYIFPDGEITNFIPNGQAKDIRLARK